MRIFRVLNWQAYLAEFIGTFVFVLISSGAVLSSIFGEDIGVLGIAMSTGLALTAMIYATAGISGGHLNPAVTFAMWLAEKINITNAIIYICFQLLGGIAAAYLLLWIFGSRSTQFLLGGPVLAADVTVQGAIVVEAVLTAALVFSIFGTMVDKRGPVSFGPLVAGLVVLASGIFAGPLTGASLNPAKALGPLLLSGSYSSILVWVIGPVTGSLAGIFYKYLFLNASKRGH